MNTRRRADKRLFPSWLHVLQRDTHTHLQLDSELKSQERAAAESGRTEKAVRAERAEVQAAGSKALPWECHR